MIGQTISHYKITAKLGEGGMGEVYRATDTKLNRDVALKVLPEAFAADRERMARFSREAQVLASLNHPNIASIYGLEDSADKHALVLELVEGETLAERIKGGAVPLEESLKIALQMAEALEAAHEKGIIHRDLKPANVKITPEGKVKVLDFGLAKALEDEIPDADLTHSPTRTDQMTNVGMIMGTAGYMSPEQAGGHVLDKRTDIWAFGCVLYEVLTGKQVFNGEQSNALWNGRRTGMTIETGRDIAAIASGLVASITLFWAVFTYARSLAMTRADRFLAMRIRFKENETFASLFELLTKKHSPELRQLSYRDKQLFLGFYEEIALLVNTGLMNKHAAHYMFSYYAIRCWNSPDFWCGMDRESRFWRLFRNFVKEMEAIEEIKPSHYKL